MKIKKIDWLSFEALEAEVIVTDGEFELVCFSHPFNYQLESNLKEPIYSFDANNIVKSDRQVYTLKKLDDNFSYHVTGKLVDIEKGKVMLGNLSIELDDDILPGDIKENDFISFSSPRFDII